MIVAGCTKDFHLDMGDVKTKYAIEGRISNMWGPYFVRVTKSDGFVKIPQEWSPYPDSAEPVKNALVIISDDMGVIDTLIPVPPSVTRWYWNYNVIDTNHSSAYIDSFYLPDSNYFINFERGYYQTTKIAGAAGHTYRLRVEIGDEVFESSAYMPHVPVLEHARYVDTVLSPYVNSGDIPMAHFRDFPDEKNFYMLSNHVIQYYRYDIPINGAMGNYLSSLPYYVFDDKLLSPGLNAVPVRHTMNNDHHDPTYIHNVAPQYPVMVVLRSLTEDTYNYFIQMHKQYNNDGNIYKPAPASVQGNISGGAFGYFFASEVSYKFIYPGK